MQNLDRFEIWLEKISVKNEVKVASGVDHIEREVCIFARSCVIQYKEIQVL